MIRFNGTLLDELRFYSFTIALILMSLIGAYGWFTLYVTPMDEAREEIMECMGDRLWTEALYSQCVDIIQRTRSSP